MMRGHGNRRVGSRLRAAGLLRLSTLALMSCSALSSDSTDDVVGVTSEAIVGQIVPSAPVGTLPGALTVGDDGTASYVLPLWVPPGRAGMQPTLALTYSSRAGNDILGNGWTIAGVSSVIARCGSTLSRDGEIRPTQYTSADHYCLDGARLVVSNGKTYHDPAAEYRTEPNTFSKIVPSYSSGIVAGWTVYTRDGKILRYAYGPGGAGPMGATSDAWLQVSNHSQTDTVRTGFLLNRVEDRDGNAITITYEHPTASYWQLKTRPKQIDYTSGPGVAANRRITFEYDLPTQPRGDVLRAWTQGTEYVTDFRLLRIKANVGGSLVRRYEFTYETSPSTSRSRLKQVQAWDAAGSYIPATTFKYSENTHSFTLVQTTPIGNGTTSFDRLALVRRGLHIGDVNGDGRDDLVFYGTNGRWNVRLATTCGSLPCFGPVTVQDRVPRGTITNPFPLAQLVDMNNDGSMDLASSYCQYEPDSQSERCRLRTYLSDGTPSSSSVKFGNSNPSYSVYYDPPLFLTSRDGFVDVDGDGFVDYFAAGFVAAFYYSGSPQSAWGPGEYLLSSDPHGGQADFSRTVFQDIDGDGHVDLLAPYNLGGGTLAYDAMHFRSRSGAREVSALPAGLTYDPCDILLDVNGDGLVDVAHLRNGSIDFNASREGPPAGPRQASFVLATNAFPVNMSGWCGTPNFDYGTRVVDFNGDGKSDILLLGKTTTSTERIRVLLAKPDGTGFDVVGGNSSSLPVLEPSDFATYGAAGNRTLDANGDGLYDVLEVASDNSVKLYIQQGTTADLLISATNGSGGTQQVEYAPLSTPGLYTPGSNCPRAANSAVRCVRDARYVVAKEYLDTGTCDVTTGVTNCPALLHSYGDALTDATQGFLGFGWHKVTDTRATRGTTTITKYGRHGESILAGGATRYPYINKPTERVSYVTDGRAYAVRQIMTYDIRTLADGTYVVFPGSRSMFRNEGTSFNPDLPDSTPTLQSSSISYSTPDDYGNVATISTTSAGFTDTTYVTQFHNDATNWLVGLPEAITATSTAPIAYSSSYTVQVTYDAKGHPSEIIREPGAATAGDGRYRRTKISWNAVGLPTNLYVAPDATDCSGTPCGPKVRSASVTYAGSDSDRMFPSSTSNSYGQTTSYLS